MGTQDQLPDTQTTQGTTPLPKGLFWRGHVLWISRNVNGQRVQVSTGCKALEEGLKAYRDFIEKHGLDKKPSPAQSCPEELPELPKGLYWKGNVIWLSRSVNGQHYNFSTGTSDPKLATQLLSDFNLKAFKGEKLGVYSRTPLTFRELAERYIEQGRLGGGLRPKSIARYQAIRDHFEKFLQMRDLAERDAGTLGPAVVEDYKAWRFSTPVRRNGSPVTNGSPASKPGASPRTVQTEVQIVGSFFRYGVQIGLVDQNPVSRTRGIRVPEKAYTYLEEDEIKRLLDVAAAYDVWAYPVDRGGSLLHDILFTYLKTGMRLEELRHLEWSDVDIARREIHIRPEKQVTVLREIPLGAVAAIRLRQMGEQGFSRLSIDERHGLLGHKLQSQPALEGLKYQDFDLKKGVVRISDAVKWSPKTRGRVIPISKKLLDVLKRLPRISNLVFPDPRGGGLWRYDITALVKLCAKRAGIEKNVYTHALRHTFATHLRRRGVPLETLKELLGHANIQETLIYAHFSPEEARAAIPKIDFF